jgi:hypothetical protein
MRAFKIISLMFLLIFSFSILKAQGQAALLMLYQNPSPRLTGWEWLVNLYQTMILLDFIITLLSLVILVRQS